MGNGGKSFLQNVISRMWRTFGKNRLVVYAAVLSAVYDNGLPDDMSVSTAGSITDIADRDIAILLHNTKNRNTRSEQFVRRFSNGAELWMARIKDEIVGYIWTINIEKDRPYFLPLLENDVLLFDAEIFSEYRGQGINSRLTQKVLIDLKNRGRERAFIQTCERNTPEIASLKKTSFKKIGLATRKPQGRKNVVIWYDMVGHEPFFIKS
jgi:ribosomal protein S18 acetylase RimI-like enzyme